MDMEIPGAPRPEEAGQYVQRMREVKEISTGQRPRSRQRRASSQRRGDAASDKGQGRQQTIDFEALSASGQQGRVDAPFGFDPRETKDVRREGNLNRANKGHAAKSGAQVGDARHERRRARESAQCDTDCAEMGEEHVRPPRRRTRTPRDSGQADRRMSPLSVVIVSVVTSALISLGAASMFPAGGALSNLFAGGWWM